MIAYMHMRMLMRIRIRVRIRIRSNIIRRLRDIRDLTVGRNCTCTCTCNGAADDTRRRGKSPNMNHGKGSKQDASKV